MALLPPVLSEAVRLDEIDNYYSFARNMGESATTRFEMWKSDSDHNASGWSNVLRVDGRNQHLILEGDDGGEVITTPGGTWSKNPDGPWEPIENPGEFGLFLSFLASPDIAYGIAYGVFEDLQFIGWSEIGGTKQAVYRGGTEAAVAILDGFGGTSSEDSEGTVEVVWSPDGYFSLVHIDVIDAGVTTTLEWVISDVGTTVVQPPPLTRTGKTSDRILKERRAGYVWPRMDDPCESIRYSPATIRRHRVDSNQGWRGPGDRHEEPKPKRTHLPRELAPVPRLPSDHTPQGRPRLPVSPLNRRRERT